MDFKKIGDELQKHFYPVGSIITFENDTMIKVVQDEENADEMKCHDKCIFNAYTICCPHGIACNKDERIDEKNIHFEIYEPSKTTTLIQKMSVPKAEYNDVIPTEKIPEKSSNEIPKIVEEIVFHQEKVNYFLGLLNDELKKIYDNIPDELKERMLKMNHQKHLMKGVPKN